MSEIIKFDLTEGLIVVKTILWGPNGPFALKFAMDTGATITTINFHALVMAGYDPAVSSQRLEMTTGSGVEYVPYLEIQKLDALSQSKRQFSVLAHTLPPSATVDGLLGLDFFLNRELRIDFRNGTIILD